jgi:hypothetical protein
MTLSQFLPILQIHSSNLPSSIFHLRRKIGQGDGIRTRTVRVTGGDANYYITTLEMDPLVGLAPTNSGLRNHSCSY